MMFTDVDKNVCFLCRKPISALFERVSTENTSISGYSSVRDFVNVLFVVSNVFQIPAERIENLMINFIAGRTKAEVEPGLVEKLLCDFCGVSVTKIGEVCKQILETSEAIDDIKNKLASGKKRRRKIKVVCDEDEPEFTPPDESEGGQGAPSYSDVDADDVDRDDAFSCPSDDDAPVPSKILRPTERQSAKRKAPRPRANTPKKKRGKPSTKVKMTCPFCQTFTEASDRAVQLCKHLQMCSIGKRDSDLATLTCVTCDKFQSSDFLVFCEHFGACAGPNEETNQVIPIQNRLISCDCCPPPSCFKFDDYLQHYLHHQKNPLKCIHPLKTGKICTSRWDCRTSYCTHWLKTHRSQPDRLPRPKSYVVEETLPTIHFFCHLCNARFPSRDIRNEHLMAIHALPRNPQNPETCPHCPFTAHIIEDVSIHVATEHPLLVNHKERHRRAHSCDLCDHHLPSEIALKRHKRIVHLIQPPKLPKKPKIFRHGCPDCGKRFEVPSQLVAHRIREHNATDLGPDPHQCSICNRTFSSLYNLKTHVNSAHGNKSPTNSCHHCGKLIGTREGLTRHLFTFHGEGSVKEYKCPREGCDKSYTTLSALRSHEAHVHAKTPLFNCEICGKGYYGKQRLNRCLLYHKHPNFRPFSCDMCPSKTYRTPHELGIHWKSGHSKEDRAELEKAGVREDQMQEFLRVVKEAGLEWNTRTAISID